ncbi:pentapeptide repeat-containing protein [Lentzea sp. NPDC003310]|uniref:pentapeptide repeat-containing protein n=1 Tax=Lentzea sp. NPDC003310 TaxID=3154447 RepID=UPI0033B8308A
MKVKKSMSPWTMPLVTVAVLLVTGAVLVALWLWVNRQTWTDPEKRTLAQLDVVKVASGIALGGGGLFTLYLAARRQRTQEEAQADLNADAEARRFTELYTKAVQQLGDEKAPVRLGGLYALERLGQQQPDQRQTIVNVLCAYLRMPYTPPPEQASAAAGVRRPLLRNSRRRVGIRRPDGPSAAAPLVESRQERDVRSTAQRILCAHLQPLSEDYWGEREINLDGAVLIDFSLFHGQIGAATFKGTTFVGRTVLVATWTGLASFYRATFTGGASFDGVFRQGAVFSEASFGGTASFSFTCFEKGSASFRGASFAVDADFDNADFSAHVNFDRATFGESVSFSGARVSGKGAAPASTWPAGWAVGTTQVRHPEREGEWYRLTQDE